MLRRKDSESDEAGAKTDIAPMIDVTFLLLIFFMCSLRFKTLDGKLNSYLPKDAGLTQLPSVPEVSSLRIRVELRGGETLVKVGGATLERLGAYRATVQDGPLILPGLQRRLEEVHEALPDLSFMIDPDERVRTGYVVAVLDACLRVGVTDVKFTVPPPPG